ncbi:hypothetical protein D9M71_672980 [compost metagenome]
MRQCLVERVDGQVDLGEALDQVRVLLLERGGNANGQLGRQRPAALWTGVAGVGQGLPGLGVERRFFKAYQRETAHQRGGRPVIEQHRFTAADRRSDLGVEGCTGAAAKVHIQIVEAIGLELLAVDRLGGPAAGAVEEAAFCRGFRVAENLGIAFEVGD